MKSTLTTLAATPERSFRLLLQSELARRCAANAQYSLRSFALHLGVDHSTLSQWLRGRRPITGRAISALGAALGLPAERVQTYVDAAGRETDGPDELAGILAPAIVASIADWYHFAILELTRLAEFRADSRWIARVLDISVDEVNLAIQHLIRLDLLEMAAVDRWDDKLGDAVLAFDALTADARSRAAAETSRLAAAAAHVPMGLREHSSVTLAVNSAQLPRAFELITRVRQQIVELLGDGRADDVYRIEIALFPVTTLKRE